MSIENNILQNISDEELIQECKNRGMDVVVWGNWEDMAGFDEWEDFNFEWGDE